MGRKILIVDDEPLFCEILRKFLVGKGYSVAEAHDGYLALEAYRQERPDVVLLDALMPGQDGLETLRSLLAFDPKARVIIVTAALDEEAAKQALAEGALEYIYKPFGLNHLEKTLQTVTARSEAIR